MAGALVSEAGAFVAGAFFLVWRAYGGPWGRMMRAIRDNEVAAEAMGKDVTARHLQVFVLGSAVCGLAGAMMATSASSEIGAERRRTSSASFGSVERRARSVGRAPHRLRPWSSRAPSGGC